ncbi:exodeoxyribonuclease VII small subunit [Gordonia soli]|uniref:Exodeoxyribonuclease 7 small subunit n=1 Tax=Gordonia soli NBRC 108243 TaxID=1223545 RepID=M0QRY0_9ACTN|nr:exodeoxyribonuclease VII small subunit [Gordonia soli]GAC70492.1 exodeoxyribonuclease VII small subunit [Gordonia soli NBRC 108243]
MSTSDDDADTLRPVTELGYEEARDELIEVVATLERGGLDLDASLALWERGEALAGRCEEHLEGARARIEAVISDSDGDEDLDEFDDDDPDDDNPDDD